jgi:hypothetical protein
MSLAEAEESLRSCLLDGLMLYRPKPPRSSDPVKIDEWRGRVADNVLKDILQSNWSLSRTLLKQPPARLHSTSQFMRKESRSNS